MVEEFSGPGTVLSNYAGFLKIIEYFQASVYSLLQAATEIASRDDGRDRDIHVFVQRR